MAIEGAARAIWTTKTRELVLEAALERELGIPKLLAAVLIARGFTEPDEASKFLSPSLADLHDPLLLPDCAEAVRQLLQAKEANERIYVHGDYDVDGVSSAALWTRSLRRLGFDVVPHVPHRIREGYGIHRLAVEEARDAGCKLFLTCDCGSSAHVTVAMARSFGMRVVVTDHHEVGDVAPEAEALVNPHRKDSAYPYKHLAGVGVAYKVAQAVAEECGASRQQFERAFLDLVALGTIADVVPLTGENRILAWHGLERLSQTKKPGLRALISKAIKKPARPLNSRDVGWALGPRLNAAGRIDDAEHSLRLLLTDDFTEAEEKAELLDQHNRSRRVEQDRILAYAEEIVLERRLHEGPLIIVAAQGWHTGVVGIVAGKLAERYYRPSFVASIGADGVAKGSARSIPGFNLHDLLTAHSDLFLSGGGHERAAGFSIDAGRLEEAQERLEAYAENLLSPEDLVPKIEADLTLHADDLTFAGVEALSKCEPFGEGNPAVRFVISGSPFSFVQPTSKPEHVRFGLAGTANLTGIGFSFGERLARYSAGDQVDLLVEPEIDEFNGSRKVNLRLTNLQSDRESSEC